MLRKRVSTRLRPRLEPLEDRLCLSSLPVVPTATQPAPATRARLTAAYGQVPLSFEVNKGQTDSRVNFLSRGAGYSLFLTPSRTLMELQQGGGGNVIAMKIVGANPTSHTVGLDKQAGVSNYFIGNDPSKWHTNIANYAKAGYQDVYRGIDLVYHGSQKQLEYDFVVEPGADPRAIRLAFAGAQGKSIDAQGNLVLHTSGGDLVEHAPVAYQTINGVRHPVASRFVIGRGGQVGFQVGHYDRSRVLVIDPVMSLGYSTYLGGSQVEYALGIAVDGSGNAYVTGRTFSNDFPTANPFQSHNMTRNGTAFVTKFNSTGTALVYSTYLGGSYSDRGTGIAVDGSGSVYVAGTTGSSDFPTVNAFQSSMTTGGDAFLAKLSPDGSALLYSTYIGGAGGNLGNGLAVDGSGNAYVTGNTYSASFPTTPGAFQTALRGAQDAFVTKINPSLAGAASLVYSTYLGGSYRDIAYGIAVDGSGNTYVTGETGSIDFPTTAGAFQSVNRGNTNAFMTKLNAAGSALVYSTYLGGSRQDYGYGIAVDGSGNAYLTGQTRSTDFPTTAGAFQTTFGGGGLDAFVAKIDPSQAGAASLVYSTYLGGIGNDSGYGIAVDSSGNAFVTGLTASTNKAGTNNFPTLLAVQPKYGGGTGGHGDAFVTKLNSTGSSLVYSTYLGGSVGDEGDAIAVDTSGNAYVTGSTSSVNFPTKNAFQPTKGGGSSSYSDVFVTKIAFN
jgi:hypothetical protein